MSLREEARNPGVLTPQYLLSGSAYGIGAIITRRQGQDTWEKTPLQGASVVSAVGGYSRSRITGEAATANVAPPSVSFSLIETETDSAFDMNRKSDQCYVRSRSSVSGLSVIGRFRAQFLQASVNLQYERAGVEPKIGLAGTTFGSSMTLDDETIHVHIDDQVASLSTLGAIESFWQRDPKYRERFRRGPGRGVQAGDAKGPPRLSRSGYIMLPIVDSIRVYNSRDPSKPTKATVRGNTVSLPGFGTIYFGELLVRAESRRLTMLRFELGCPDEGRLAICGSESIGEYCPP